MRKTSMIFSSIVICITVCLCSCSGIETRLSLPKGTINFNYNNISTYNDFWMTDKNICYLEDNLFQYYCMVTEKGKTNLCSNSGYGSGTIQQYDNLIYMMEEIENIDEDNSKYLLKTYDINTKKIENITILKNCDNFLLLNETVYYLQYDWSKTPRTLTLHSFCPTLNTEETICDNVLSFGVIDNHLVYVVKENDVISIFKHNEGDISSEKIGEFIIETPDNIDFNESASFCYSSDYVLISYADDKNNSSTVWKYQFDTSEVTQVSLDGYVGDFVTFDRFSYMAIYEDENTEVSCIYRLSNDTDELLKIGQIEGWCSLFVGSDEGAYILKATGEVLYCSNEGKIKKVCN